MPQTYDKEMKMKTLEIEETDVHSQEIIKEVELLGDLNPKYFEENISLEEAKEKAYASRVDVGSKFNFFSAF
ncbi:MAG: hypothetical protein ACFFEN_03445 [Candidatus Thorarchaeota archaeon]